jgi:hypothetical protein
VSQSSVSDSVKSGFEGQEQRLGEAVALAIRTLKDAMPYQHELNDALVKMHLNSVQFAKNAGLMQAYVAHDIQTMGPTLERIKARMDATGDPEDSLRGVFDGTSAFYQLCLDLEEAPGQRRFTFPFSTVLAISKRIGQFDMTDEEVHEIWLRPRLLGYAQALGVRWEVSDLDAEGKITVKLVN